MRYKALTRPEYDDTLVLKDNGTDEAIAKVHSEPSAQLIVKLLNEHSEERPTIILGKIRQLDLDKQEGRVHSDVASSGERVVTFKVSRTGSIAANVRNAFFHELHVVMVINNKGWVDNLYELTALGVET